MAGEKTEQPTDKKLRKAREKGQVAKSTDLVQAAVFLGAAAALWVSGEGMMETLLSMLQGLQRNGLLAGDLPHGKLLGIVGGWWQSAMFALLPLLAVVVLMSVAANFLQVRALFSVASLQPDLNKLNPLEGLKQIFLKPRTYLDLLKNLLKLAIIVWIAWMAIDAILRDLLLAGAIRPDRLGAIAADSIYRILIQTGAAFLVIGAADFVLQKKLYIKDQMMTKEEVKREYKEDEGDPYVKHHRKGMHQELLQEGEVANVPAADVVVVNPTHLAVALKYDQETMNAPRVVAKGRNLHAEKIRELARKHQVPIARNVYLARQLIRVETGNEVPEDLYEDVAEVLLWVYELKAERGRSGGG
ncbi:MAG: type III secretion system export apparatus subunit SctU [Bryobacterales bacterium]|jgi:type III secretion YscU/HrpY family protein|nr:type III secretion system export apparatus subunit SctU [Bryobacterales bacterium]